MSNPPSSRTGHSPPWRRRGYAAAVMVALVAGILAVARFAPAVTDATGRIDATPAADPVVAAPDAAAAAAEAGALEAAAGDGMAEAPLLTGAAAFEFPSITDGVARVTKPAQVRAIYLNAWAAGSSGRLERLIELANRTEINSFVIDVKEGGEISYRSRVPLARQIGADQPHIRDVRALLSRLRDNGIYPIARIVVFRDAVLAQARPDWAVRHRDGGDWIDSYGHHWVDSYNREVWDYNIAIAREALELGFSEVQWDYVRFPDVPQSFMRTAHWPARDGRTMAQGIREFLLYSREQLQPYGVPVTADVFGLTVSVRNDMGIGQLWEKMVDATDVLLPMVYPSHFAPGSYGIEQPNAQPFEIISTAMRHAVRRTAGVEGAATIRPWLQDFTLGAPRYGPAHVRAQIDAVYAAGLEEWVLWNPGSNYTVAALADAEGRAPRFPRPTAGDVEAADSTGADSTATGSTDAGARVRPLGTPLPDTAGAAPPR